MENIRHLTALQFSGLTDPDALYSENVDYRNAARAVQNGQVESVDDKDMGDVHLITTTYTTTDSVWRFEVEYPVFRQNIGDDACRPEHSIFSNVYIDKHLTSLFIGDKLTFRNCVFGTGIKLTETREFSAEYCVMMHETHAIGDKVLTGMS